ncbi:hypothetical protein HKX48_000425, partial [Thoreauomyces humboldtii]
VDCGFAGITQSACQAKSCCWSQSSVSGTPWCFYKSNLVPVAPTVVPVATSCNVAVSARKDCGSTSSTQNSCLASGCCWSPVNNNPTNAPWCFVKA